MMKFILKLVFIISILLNILFVSVEYYNHYNYNKLDYLLAFETDKQPSIESFQNELLNGGKYITENQIDLYVPTQRNTFVDRFYDLYRGGTRNSWRVETQYKWSEAGYMLQAMWDAAKLNADTCLLDYIRQTFDLHCLNSELKNVDQSVYGHLSILLYEEYKDPKYKEFADCNYNWLKSLYEEQFGIRFFKNVSMNHVDAVGVYNPFLIKYSKAFDCPEAYDLAVKCLELWIEYGVEPSLGRPSQCFRTNPPYEKVGRSDWGRGFAWYMLGFNDIDRADLSDNANALIDKFVDYIKYIYERDGKFTQFVNSPSGDIALDATLPLLWYLYKEQLVDVSENDILEYSKYMKDGVMYHSSGILKKVPVNNSSSQRLSQAFMLNIINEYQRRH